MAKKLEFTLRGTTQYTLLGNTDGIKPLVGTWRTSRISDMRWRESMLLAGTVAATSFEGIAELSIFGREVINYWKDLVNINIPKVVIQAESEAAERSAIVYKFNLTEQPRGYETPLQNTNVTYYLLEFERGPWQLSTVTTTVTGMTIPGHGSGYQGSLTAMLPGMISGVTLTPKTSGMTLNNVWVGFLPDYYSNSSFDPLWEAERGTLGASSSLVTDSDASPSGGANNAVNMDVTTTQAKCVRLLNVNTSLNVGQFLVLGRLRATTDPSGINVGMQLAVGLGSLAYKPEVWRTITTSYALYELGEVIIDATDPAFSGNYTIDLYLRATAAVTVNLDCLVLVPSRVMATAKNADVGYTGGGRIYTLAFETSYRRATWRGYKTDRGTASDSTDDSLDIDYTVETTFSDDWEMPAPYWFLVVAADGAVGDQIDTSVTWNPRFEVYGSS